MLNPLVKWRSPDQLADDEQQRLASSAPPSPVILALAGHIRKCFDEAKNHRDSSGITEILLACKRQRKGEYDPKILAEIQRAGGSQLYYRLTDTKCTAAEALLVQVLLDSRPWQLKPSPISDLPAQYYEEAQARIDAAQMAQETQAAVRQAEAAMPLDPAAPPVSEPVDPLQAQIQAVNMAYDAIKAELQKEAETIADRHSKVAEDQLSDGGYNKALHDFIRTFSTYPLAILKGPVLTRGTFLQWDQQNGGVKVDERPNLTWYAVSPFLWYPNPFASRVNQGYCCEVSYIDPADLANYKGVDGWNTAAIDAYLTDTAAQGMAGLTTADISSETTRDKIDKRASSGFYTQGVPGMAIEYWGSVSGRVLKEWMGTRGSGDKNSTLTPESLQDTQFYHITATLMGNHVVRAVANPDPLGRWPYFVASYFPEPNVLWAESIPQRLSDLQQGATACVRNAVNNLAMCSGPIVDVDVDAFDDGAAPHAITPWMVIHYHGAAVAPGHKPVNLFQPQCNADQFFNSAAWFEERTDDRVQLPRFMHGSDDATGAAETATGLSILMDASQRGFQAVAINLDDCVIRPSIQRLVDWNNRYHADAGIKGDIRVEPHGIVAQLMEAQKQLRLKDALELTNNQIDMQILGLEGRYKLLKEYLVKIGRLDILPSEDEFRQKMQAIAVQEAAMAAQQAAQPGMQPAGAPV